MQQRSDPYTLPDGLPVPTDDGACDHLAGMALPSIPLSTTDGEKIDLSSLRGRSVVYVYPRTGRPDLLHLPFPLSSDSDLIFTRALGLPTFEFDPYGEESSTLLKRMAFVIRDGRIEKCSIRCFRRTGMPRR